MKYQVMLLLFLGLLAQAGMAQNLISIDAAFLNTTPKGKIQYFVDTIGFSRPEEVKPAYFTSIDKQVLSLDFQKESVWVYLKALNKLENDGFFLGISNPLIDSIQAYIRVDDGQWQESVETGAAYNFDSRNIKHQHFIIPFEVSKGQVVEVMLKVRSTTPLQLPIKIYSEQTIVDKLGSWDFGRGLFYGIMAVMFLYNLFVSLSTKDRAYYYYVAYVLFITLTQTVLDGTLEKYIVNLEPRYLKYLLIIFPTVSGIAAIQFAKAFMHLKETSRKLNIGMSAIQVVYTIAPVFLVLGLSEFAFRNIDLAGALASFYAFAVAGYLSFKGHRSAKLFLMAWSIFLASLIIYILRNVGVVAYSNFTEYILQIGIASEVVLLSFALADRINTLRKEKQETQAANLRISQENEQIIRDQNILLEKKVDERTAELQDANEELSVTLTNLREAQSQLVDAEKMASLGQLTAGIAHEINNPINFVSSNIKPLSRDLDDLYEIVDHYKLVEGQELEAKLQKAHALRQELDYDFVKEEIRDLVQGISDGAHRTSEIVKGLRTFSRLDEDVIKSASLEEGITSTLVLLRSKINGNVEVIEDYDPEVNEIECYPGKLNQVFMNILNNAVYAVTHKEFPEGEKPTLILKTRQDGENVKVHLQDNGLGMDEATQKKLFEPFFTTKDVGEGTGLGMSIVFRIVEKHGGKVEVESELGVGTEFIITLPVRQPNEFE